jgi:hypothetical protein
VANSAAETTSDVASCLLWKTWLFPNKSAYGCKVQRALVVVWHNMYGPNYSGILYSLSKYFLIKTTFRKWVINNFKIRVRSYFAVEGTLQIWALTLLNYSFYRKLPKTSYIRVPQIGQCLCLERMHVPFRCFPETTTDSTVLKSYLLSIIQV